MSSPSARRTKGRGPRLTEVASPSLRIAALRVEDAEAIAVLQNRLWRSTYAGLLPPQVLSARDDETNIGVWRDRAAAHERDGVSPEGTRTLVAHDERGGAIGWATTGPPRDADPPTTTELWSLYVAPEHHGRGVARRLLPAVLPSSAAAHLWVVSGNDRAIAFYRKEGFAPDGSVLHDDRVGAEELRMVRGSARE